jgi:DNA-binding transcriptional LysR family regulator
MDRFLSIEAFVRVAEAESFAEAARQLGVAKSVVTTRVKQLEAYVGAPLFHRSTRHVRLSEAGAACYKECAELILRFDGLTDHMGELKSSPAGILRVHALPGFALEHLSRALGEFQERNPGIELDVVVNDRVVDPVEEGYDVTLQIFPPASSALIERRLFPVRRLFCAAPAYLDQHGTPENPRALLEHRVALYSRYPTRNKWTFHNGAEKVELELPGCLRSNSVHLLRDYAVAAGGVVCLPTFVASAELVAGRLVPLLAEYQLASFWLTAVYPATHRATAKLRRFLDFVASRFPAEPPWDAPLIERGIVRQGAAPDASAAHG